MSEEARLASFGDGAGRGLAVALALAYPLLIAIGLVRFDTGVVAALVLVALGLRVALAYARSSARPEAREHFWALAGQLAPVAVLAVFGWLSGDARFLLALPVLVNLALLFVFGRSLRTPLPIVERFARATDPDLSADEVDYCRRVTWVWCGFFALNAAVTALLAAFASLWWWTLHTGLLAYLAMGSLFAVEFLLRRARFGRFGDGPADRLALRLIGPKRSGAPIAEASEVPRSAGDRARRGWTEIAEKGSVLAVRFVLFSCVALGRAPTRVVMRAVALYYVLSDATLRRVSREFHARVGIPATFGAIYRHVRTFAFCSTDRIFLLRGDKHLFRISRYGRENGERVRRAGRGGIMIGAHFGSFEALRATAEYDDLPLSIVAYFENAAISNAIFESLDPELAKRVIQVRPGDVGYLLEVRRRIRAGELVAFLGDRAIPGTETVEVDFLGSPARFPTGVFQIAATIGCPVVLIFGVYREPNVYEMHCEAFADRIELPRRGGLEQKRRIVQRYASRLEHYVRSTPTNWFNFYDFWESSASRTQGASGPRSASSGPAPRAAAAEPACAEGQGSQKKMGTPMKAS